MKTLLKILVIVFLVLASTIFYNNLRNKGFSEKLIDTNKLPVSRNISIGFVGDILLASNVERRINETSVKFPFERVQEILASKDFAIGNLESAIATGGSPAANKRYTFRANPKVLDGVRWSGIDILSVSNNHVFDYGKTAFRDTLQNIKSYNLKYIGAGEDDNEAYSPVILEKNGKKIAFLGASRVIPNVGWYAGKNKPGVAGVYNSAKLVEQIRKVKKEADVVIVYLHWGVEKEIIPKPYQRNLAKELIDNGADIVAGTHPHVLQGFEFYKGKLIAYSLGNFVFTNFKNETLILTVEFGDEGLAVVEIIPCLINNYRPEPIIDYEQKKNFYKKIEDRSFGIYIKDEGGLGKKVK